METTKQYIEQALKPYEDVQQKKIDIAQAIGVGTKERFNSKRLIKQMRIRGWSENRIDNYFNMLSTSKIYDNKNNV